MAVGASDTLVCASQLESRVPIVIENQELPGFVRVAAFAIRRRSGLLELLAVRAPVTIHTSISDFRPDQTRDPVRVLAPMAANTSDLCVRAMQSGSRSRVVERHRAPTRDGVAGRASVRDAVPVQPPRMNIFVTGDAARGAESETRDGFNSALVTAIARDRSVGALEGIRADLMVGQRVPRRPEPLHIVTCVAATTVRPVRELAGVDVIVAGHAALELVDCQRTAGGMAPIA